MPALPCLAYLLDTPVEPGAVVTYRCTRPAGHAADHHDAERGRSWTSTAGVAWAEGAVYPARPDRYPWNGDPAPAAVPPMPATPTPTDGAPPAGNPWARARADAIAARHAHPTS